MHANGPANCEHDVFGYTIFIKIHNTKTFQGSKQTTYTVWAKFCALVIEECVKFQLTKQPVYFFLVPSIYSYLDTVYEMKEEKMVERLVLP